MKYEVINLEDNTSHGEYDDLDEAKGCVSYDRLTQWEIWRTEEGVKVVDDVAVEVKSSTRVASKARRG